MDSNGRNISAIQSPAFMLGVLKGNGSFAQAFFYLLWYKPPAAEWQPVLKKRIGRLWICLIPGSLVFGWLNSSSSVLIEQHSKHVHRVESAHIIAHSSHSIHSVHAVAHSAQSRQH